MGQARSLGISERNRFSKTFSMSRTGRGNLSTIFMKRQARLRYLESVEWTPLDLSAPVRKQWLVAADFGTPQKRSIAPLAESSRAERLFPTLTPDQVARVKAHGRIRPVGSGEMLASAGELVESFFVVTDGVRRDRSAPAGCRGNHRRSGAGTVHGRDQHDLREARAREPPSG